MKRIIFFLLSVPLFACSPKVKSKITTPYTALDPNERVVLFDKNDSMPIEAISIGTVKIGDTGFSVDCGWDVTIEKAKEAARASGGNVLKIIQHKKPNGGSTCDRITAEVFKIENAIAEAIWNNQNAVTDSTWNYAKLYVYRPSGPGQLVGYNLFLDDSLLCKVKNNSKQEIIVKQFGKHIISASTESKFELSINIEQGKEYYIRCGIVMGAFVGRPKMYLIEKPIGKSEYKALKGR